VDGDGDGGAGSVVYTAPHRYNHSICRLPTSLLGENCCWVSVEEIVFVHRIVAMATHVVGRCEILFLDMQIVDCRWMFFTAFSPLHLDIAMGRLRRVEGRVVPAGGGSG